MQLAFFETEENWTTDSFCINCKVLYPFEVVALFWSIKSKKDIEKIGKQSRKFRAIETEYARSKRNHLELVFLG